MRIMSVETMILGAIPIVMSIPLLWFFKYYKDTKAIGATYLDVKKDPDRMLLLIDDGKENYDLISAKKEALSIVTERYGLFERDDPSIKNLTGAGVGLGLAHCELETLIDPDVARFAKAHGQELTRNVVVALPDKFTYYYCNNKKYEWTVKEDGEEKKIVAPCNWASKLEQSNGEVKKWRKTYATLIEYNEKWGKKINDALPTMLQKKNNGDDEQPEPPALKCPRCESDTTLIEAKEKYQYQIPNATLFDLKDAVNWVDEVASPITSDIRVKKAYDQGRRDGKQAEDTTIKFLAAIGMVVFMAALAYKIAVSGGGDIVADTVQSVGM